MSKPSRSYLLNSALACGVLYYVLELSSPGRTAVDWVVIALVLGALAWNLVRLARRLHQRWGGRAVWEVCRTVLFWIVGLGNTAFARPETTSWQTWLGWSLLALAVLDSVRLFYRERQALDASAG